MADFDFDELDRAVSGALDSAAGSSAPSQNEPVSESPAISTHSSTTIPSSAAKAPSLTRDTSPAVQRSTGRFMDVVHPSSDMRPGSSEPVVSAPPVVRNTAPVIETQKAEAFADTLDDWQQPLESPFLPDAKVEKRPLGGETPSTADFDALDLLEAPDEPRIETGTMPDPIDFALSQAANNPQQDTTEKTIDEVELTEVDEPAEDESAKFTVLEESTEPLEEEVAPAVAPVETVTETPTTHEYGAGYGEGSFQPIDTPAEEPVGPTSITQQYKEQPSTTAEPSAIYDTEAYKPLIPVAKKKSGVWTTLWIVLILLLGGGAGAAIYFFVLPML